MSTKSQTVFAVCFGLFLAVVVTVSLLFADKLPNATQPEGITGGYLFSFNETLEWCKGRKWCKL